jgi:hypothetical protein
LDVINLKKNNMKIIFENKIYRLKKIHGEICVIEDLEADLIQYPKGLFPPSYIVKIEYIAHV